MFARSSLSAREAGSKADYSVSAPLSELKIMFILFCAILRDGPDGRSSQTRPMSWMHKSDTLACLLERSVLLIRVKLG